MNRRPFRSVLPLLAAVLLAGCFSKPRIDRAAFQPPRSVVIVDVPRITMLADFEKDFRIDPASHMRQWHFTERADRFFEAPDPEPAASGPAYSEAATTAAVNNLPSMPGGYTAGNAALSGVAGGVMGALMELRAQKLRKQVVGFPAARRKHFPDDDDRAAFMDSLRQELEQRGLRVTILPSGDESPRLRWPATDEAARYDYPPRVDDAPAVDADVLLQVSPVMAARSSGPMSPFTLTATVGIALFDGRGKRFIGRQTLVSELSDPYYPDYDALEADIPRAVPALRKALLGAVPAIGDIVAGSSRR